jgi:hypothetical protein
VKTFQAAIFKWTGEVMQPTPESLPLCMRQFEIGELYQLSAERQRSVASHREFMALINEAFANLPEQHQGRWPTVDRLRYWCLVKCNYSHEETFPWQTKQDADRFVEYVLAKQENCIAQADGNVARVWTAKSQRYKHDPEMAFEEFEKAKEDVLQLLADLIGVHPRELKRNAGKAA